MVKTILSLNLNILQRIIIKQVIMDKVKIIEILDDLINEGGTYEVARDKLFDLLVVSRSVWVVQNKTSKVAHCIFTTQGEATDCIDGLTNYEVKEFSLVNNSDL